MVSGGKRRGAGRPRAADRERKITLCIRIAPDLRVKLERFSELKNQSIGAIVSALIRDNL